MTNPTETRALILVNAKEGSTLHYDTEIVTRPIPTLKDGEILVRIGAAGFNHRELWQRKNMYPSTTVNTVIGADGAGVVVASSDPLDPLLRQKVFLVPMRGWESHPDAPETYFTIIGGIKLAGTFAEFVVVDRQQVITVPPHLPLIYAAAWPVAGVTAWRAVMIKGAVKKGDNVLITGIGGGVALVALQLCVAVGANVFVTSSAPSKIEKAISLGAIGGVNYKSKTWGSDLGTLLKKSGGSPFLNVVIDSAGGDLLGPLGKYILASGARVVCYGMTAAPNVIFRMGDVLKNIELKGSTMGSRLDLIQATEFISKHNIVPEVSHVLQGLESAEQGFDLMRSGSQMGKIVIKFAGRTPEGEVRL